MGDQSRSVTGTISVSDKSKEAVALDLMKFIVRGSEAEQDKALTLFARCLLTIDYPQDGVEEIKRMAKALKV